VSGKQCSGTERHSRVIHIIMWGEPSEEELAALTVVLVGLTAAAQPAGPDAALSAWADPALGLRTPHYPGPDAWRTSTRPR
jgi:hypothetical protein